MTKVIYLKNSPYFNTAQISNYVEYLDFWNGSYITANVDDTLITLESKYTKRPDLLSFDMYNTPQLWWVFMLRNPDVIKDPIWDFLPNIAIYVPSKTSLKGYL